MISAKMKWTDGLKFEGSSAFGHKIVTDSSKQTGGEEAGYTPTELLLYSIAGCTGIDVVRVMGKMRQNLESLEIEVVAHQNKDLDPEKLKKAIELSEDKYCVVSQTVKEVGKVVTSYEIV